ncbi:MAG: hypothetical protein KAV87_36045 [Desulfobacteraceae bacterium]|nr:hypothetical protein [Desulfobacteraceae bacterium]
MSDAVRALQEPINSVKIAIASTGVGGGVTTATVVTSDGGFMARLYSFGTDHMLAGWDSQDTLTVIGFCITLYGLHLTRMGLKSRRREMNLKYKRRHGDG